MSPLFITSQSIDGIDAVAGGGRWVGIASIGGPVRHRLDEKEP